jgi:hypothetical protein
MSPREHEFVPRAVNVPFVEDQVRLGEAFLRAVLFFPANIIQRISLSVDDHFVRCSSHVVTPPHNNYNSTPEAAVVTVVWNKFLLNFAYPGKLFVQQQQ